MDYAYKKCPGKGLCAVKGCRNRISAKKKDLCSRHHMRLWRSRNPVRAAYTTLKHHALARRKVFTLTFEEFQQIAELNRYIDGKGCTRLALHMDRMDDRKGYEAGNIRVITCGENVAKENRRRFVEYFRETDEEMNPF